VLPTVEGFKALGNWCDAACMALCRNCCQVSVLCREFAEAYQLTPQKSRMEHKPTSTLRETAGLSGHLQNIPKDAVIC